MNHLHISPLPLGAQLLCVWTLTTGYQLRDLRAALHRALTTHHPGTGLAEDEIAEQMVLVATELATNAIRHGMPPTEVRLLQAGDRYILDVADKDHDSTPQPAPDRPRGDGGLGLVLADALALHVGWYADEHSKHIWASFPTTTTSG